MPRSVHVRTPGEAEAALAELGCPVVVKVAAAIHKTDVGGVRLGLTTPAAAAQAVRAIRADLGSAGMAELAGELLVQEQVGAGQEMIVGFNRDPLLGPLVVVGLGGRLVELLGDVAVRVAPLTDDDVTDMVRSLASYRLLTGYRGGRPSISTRSTRCSAPCRPLPKITRSSSRWTSTRCSSSRRAPWPPTSGRLGQGYKDRS